MSVQELRARTGAGVVACSTALKEANGDIEEAILILRKKGEARADGFVTRSATSGVVGSYIHHDKSVGVMVVLACETDFVARTPEFQELANNIAMHVMASNPPFLGLKDIPEAIVDRERMLASMELEKRGMSGEKLQRALQGKLDKILAEKTLLGQAFVVAQGATVEQAIKGFSAKCGEKIEVKSFVRAHI